MSKNLTVKITKRTTKGEQAWEGTVSLPGVAPTKLVKAKTNESRFSTRTALAGAAQRLAERYGFAEVKFEGAIEAKEQDTKKNKKRTTTKRRQTTQTTTESATAPAL